MKHGADGMGLVNVGRASVADSHGDGIMHAITFDDCFGWLHVAPENAARNTAILLCPGIGRDANNAHRSFRMLADQLAASGYSTLRFDYRGTGDAKDAPGDQWSVWRQDVDAAADRLRAETGASRVVLVGLRLGAALAAQAACTRDDVVGLILLEPVIRGKSYAGQLVVEARLSGARSGSTAPGDKLHLHGLQLNGDTLRNMSALDLRALALEPRCAVICFNHAITPVVSECAEVWRDAGVAVTLEILGGMTPLLRPAHLSASKGPLDFGAVLAWLRTAVGSRRVRRSQAAFRPAGTKLWTEQWTETPCRFGPGMRLFGVLCRPRYPVQSEVVVVIVNTGGDPHHGFARFSVEFARRLASAGFSSLRMDFAGLGDSPGPETGRSEAPTQIFSSDRRPDITAAIDMLAALGFVHFAIEGLCSGAYHAFHAALADPRIGWLLLINLPRFTVRFDRAGHDSVAQRGMTELSRRGVRTLLLFGPEDAGLKVLRKQIDIDGMATNISSDIMLAIMPGWDHDLSGTVMRAQACDGMIGFLGDEPSRRHEPQSGGSSMPVRDAVMAD